MKLNRKTYSRNISYLSIRDFSLLFIPVLMMCVLAIFYFNVLFRHLNFKGIRAIKKNNFSLALKYFSQSVEEQPLNPWSHLNVALTHDLFRNPLKAMQVYKVVSSQFDGLAQFFSYFNQAELNGRLGFLDKALENYQEALEFKYKEKEIKENIELLFQNNEKKKNDKKKDQQEEKGQKGESGQEENEDNSRQKSKKEQDDVEKRTENEENNQQEKEQRKPGDLSKEQEEAILKAIEQQEGEVRAKVFKKKDYYGDKTGRDW